MNTRRDRAPFRWLAFALLGLVPTVLWAGGSGLNVAVVVNQASSNSVALGNYYCERRQVPSQNVLRIHWTGGNIEWSLAQFQTALAAPLQDMLAARALTNQIDCVALSMDIPYRVTSANGVNSTTAVLFYGFKADTVSPLPAYPSCSLPPDSANAYANSELPFRLSPPGTNTGGFLATMLTGFTFADAIALVDRGVSSDGSFPTQTVLLEKTTDPARNVRFITFDNAIFDLSLNGRFPLVRTNSNEIPGLTNLLGLQTGLAGFNLASNAFVPGALADTLTSYGGDLFENTGQTPLLAFLRAGAAGSYGTVVEPCNYTEKFPNPLDYFYAARGFGLAESYYQSVLNPYQGLMVAEPLSAPFARPGIGVWSELASNAILSGVASLSLAFNASDASQPLQQVDLFVDGVKLQTLTNLPPAPSNNLVVTLAGVTTNYVVPEGATLRSVTEGLASTLNALSDQNKVEAIATGDRIELESTDVLRPGAETSVSVSNASGGASFLSSFLRVAQPVFLDSVARGYRVFQVSGTSVEGDFLALTITKTNGEIVALSVTNSSPPVTAPELTRQLLALLNAMPALQDFDGVSAEDTYRSGSTGLQCLLFARSPGWPAAQIQISLQASTNLVVSPTGIQRFEENLADLRPRNHLYITAGATNLSFSFSLDTAALTDGWHEVAAVAYEGSHVRTQTRATQSIRVNNTPLAVTFVSSAPQGLAALGDTLDFAVVANTNAIARVELFSTGGALGVVSNQPTANFAFAATNLGPGLHPFYAVVVDSFGNRYRTQTQFIRISVNPRPPIAVTGLVELENFVGASRDVVFVATAGLTGTNALQTNLLTLTFTNAGSARQAAYSLTVLPNTIHLSARSAGYLRKRLPLDFANGQATADFTGESRLRGGDIDGSNLVDVFDYFALAAAWYTLDPVADIDGSGLVDLEDYFLLSSNWYLQGDPE